MVEESAEVSTRSAGKKSVTAGAGSRPPPPAVSVAGVGTPPRVVKEDRPPLVELEVAAAEELLRPEQIAEDQKTCREVQRQIAGQRPQDVDLQEKD